MTYTTAWTVTPQTQSRDEIRQQVQTTIRDALQATREAVRQSQVEAGPAIAGIPAPNSVIDALRAELAAEKANVTKLTQELVPGLSEARTEAINQQLDKANDRVQQVQGQLDHALGVPQGSSEMFAPPMFPGEERIPAEVVPIVGVVMGTLAFMVVGWPIARAWARRMDRRNSMPAPAADMSPRFDRVEQALEAVAIEVERISEGQRYTTKLMSEIRALPAPNPLNDWPGLQQRAGEPAERRSEGKV